MKVKNVSFTCIVCLLCCLAFILSACHSEQAPGVVAAEINSQGEFVLIYQDGTQQNLGVVVGKDGSNGEDGEDGKDGKDGENATLVTEGLEHAVSSASDKGLLSAVSIVCNFKATVQQGGI